MSGCTRLKTVLFSHTPVVQFQVTPEEPPPLSSVTSDQVLNDSIGLQSVTNQAEMLSVFDTCGVVDRRRRQVSPTVGERGPPSLSVGDGGRTPSTGGHGGTPSASAALLATQEDIDGTLDDQRPPYKPRACRTATRLTSRYQGATRKLCGRSTTIFETICRGGRFTDCWMRGLSSRCSNHCELYQCNVFF